MGSSDLPQAYTYVGAHSSGDSEPEEVMEVLVEPRSTHTRSISHWRKPKHPRYRRRYLVNYSRSVAVGKEDVIVKLVSPGKRKSLMSVEFRF